MALTDINFSEGEGQDFLVEIPTAVHNGTLQDVVFEPNGFQGLTNEIPAAVGGGDTIFIMSE